jgi:hypothetical protein
VNMVGEDGRMRSRGSFRAWAWVSVSIALLIVGTGWLAWWLFERTRTDDGPAVASVLGLPLAVLSLVTGIVSALAAVRSVLSIPSGRGDGVMPLQPIAGPLMPTVLVPSGARTGSEPVRRWRCASGRCCRSPQSRSRS